MKKISEWLGEHDAWTIYDSAKLREAFTKETGKEPRWPEFKQSQTRRIMRDRGLGGNIKPAEPQVMHAYGYTTAIGLASHYVPGFQSTKNGRGSAF